MHARRLGCLTPVGITAALLTILVTSVVGVVTGGAMFSPGGLNASQGPMRKSVTSHAQLATECSACHSAPWSEASMSDLCLDCHEEIQAELSQEDSLHSAMINAPGQVNCRECHTEHHGAAGILTHLDTASFPHDKTGYSLAAHARNADGEAFNCRDCHGDDISSFQQAACADCHQQLDAVYLTGHTAAFGNDCLGCHDGIDTYGVRFDHANTRFPLTGKHVPLDCRACHAGMTTPDMLQATTQECVSCHNEDDAHQGQFGQQCSDCHKPEGWKPASFDHNQRTSFALTGRHVDVQCSGCHANNRFSGTPGDCAACHLKNDAHQGQFGTDCAACHTPEGWKPASFDHSKSTFPLIGKHKGVECSACHTNQVYRGTSTNCSACHAKDDIHAGAMGADCSLCHIPDGWDQIIFDHAKSKFPLTGAHVGLACLQCHKNAVYSGLPTACSSCHSDPAYHGGLFGAGCAACHSTSAWRPASYHGPHSFPMGHGGAGSCRDCHPSSLGGWTCYTCHAQSDIAGKHNEEGISDFSNCLSCHADGSEHGGGNGGGGGGGDD